MQEENPFEDPKIAREWITHMKLDEGRHREELIYPKLREWVSNIRPSQVLEIGSGDGVCSNHIKGSDTHYKGVEPSTILLNRAIKLYSGDDTEFIRGNAYDLPIEDGEMDGVFSVNVWFHLEDLNKASAELSRVLKSGGSFLIITGNPDAYDEWESFFIDYEKQDDKLVGSVGVPGQNLTKNVFYLHDLSDILQSLESNGLTVNNVEALTIEEESPGLFISIKGKKGSTR